MTDNYCNNCGKPGHIYNQCKIPITSFGIIAFRYNTQNQLEYLMIRRKDTLGYNDFMRGKYSVYNKEYTATGGETTITWTDMIGKDCVYVSRGGIDVRGIINSGTPSGEQVKWNSTTGVLTFARALEADEFVHFLGNCHIYNEHIEPLQKRKKLMKK